LVEGIVSESGLEAELRVRRSETFHVDVAFSIAPGETVALLGPNGAGKSTTVAALAGLLPIDGGSIILDRIELENPEAALFVAAEERRVGVVFQDYLLFPHLNALENVAFGLRSRGVSRAEASARSRKWLARLGLDGLEEHRPGDLSGGQAQRVALARALVTEPRLLLLDEPLSALDVTTRTELRRTLGEHLAEFEGPRLLITHDPTEAFLLADRIHIMEHGTITQTGSGDDILLHPRTPYAADLAGSNLIRGRAKGGAVEVDSHSLHVADDIADGPVLVTIHPNAVSVHMRRPEGSPRNAWRTTVQRFERLGTRARLRTGAPLPLTVELTTAAGDELGLVPGSEIWVAVKATEIGVQSDGGE
jgi:molybdate transport system ATP-binding protein